MATAAQIAARERFAEMARSGAFARNAKRNPAKKTVSQKISQLTREGYPQKQAVAIALSEKRQGKVKANPTRKKSATSLSPETTVYKRYTIVSPASSDTVYIVRGGTNIGSARSIAEAKKIIDMLTEGVDNPRVKGNPAKKTVSQKISRSNEHFAKFYGFNPDLIELVGIRANVLQAEGLSQTEAFKQAVLEAKTATGAFSYLKTNPRASNPVLLIRDIGSKKKRQRNPAHKSYIVSTANGAGKPARAIATFGSARDAKQFAQTYADDKGKRMTVSS